MKKLLVIMFLVAYVPLTMSMRDQNGQAQHNIMLQSKDKKLTVVPQDLFASQSGYIKNWLKDFRGSQEQKLVNVPIADEMLQIIIACINEPGIVDQVLALLTKSHTWYLKFIEAVQILDMPALMVKIPAVSELAQVVDFPRKDAQARDISVTSIAMNRNGQEVVAGYIDGVVCLIRIKSKETITRKYGKSIRAAAITRDGAYVIVNDSEDNLYVWNTREDKSVNLAKVDSFAVSNSGDFIIISSRQEGRIGLCKCTMQGGVIKFLSRNQGFIDSLKISSDDTYIITRNTRKNEQMYVWNIETGNVTIPMHKNGTAANVLAISPDATLLASYEGRVLNVRKTQTRALVCAINVTDGLPMAATISADNTFVVTEQRGGNAYMWDIRTGRLVHTLRSTYIGVHDIVQDPIISNDGSTILTGLGSSKIHVWDTKTGLLLYSLHNDLGFYSAVINRDGMVVAAQVAVYQYGALSRYAMRIWNLVNLEYMRMLHVNDWLLITKIKGQTDHNGQIDISGSSRENRDCREMFLRLPDRVRFILKPYVILPVRVTA